MFAKYIASVLSRYLGSFIKDIDKDSVNVSVLRGSFELHNLEPKPITIPANVPIKLVKGVIGSLKISIPWRKLYSERCTIQLSNVCLVVSCMTSQTHEDFIRNATESKLRMLELFKLTEGAPLHSHQDEQDSETKKKTGYGFFDRLRKSILNNIRLELSAVTVRFEAPGDVQSAAVILRIPLLKCEATDSVFQPAFITAEQSVIHRALSCENVTMHIQRHRADCRTDWVSLTGNEFLRACEECSPEQGFLSVLEPSCGAVCVALQVPSDDKQILRTVSVTVKVKSGKVCLGHTTCQSLLQLFSNILLAKVVLNDIGLLQRANRQSRSTARRRWWFTVDTVLSSLRQKTRKRRFYWDEYLEWKNKGNNYYYAALNELGAPWVAILDSQFSDFKGLEKDPSLSLDDLVDCRRQAKSAIEHFERTGAIRPYRPYRSLVPIDSPTTAPSENKNKGLSSGASHKYASHTTVMLPFNLLATLEWQSFRLCLDDDISLLISGLFVSTSMVGPVVAGHIGVHSVTVQHHCQLLNTSTALSGQARAADVLKIDGGGQETNSSAVTVSCGIDFSRNDDVVVEIVVLSATVFVDDEFISAVAAKTVLYSDLNTSAPLPVENVSFGATANIATGLGSKEMERAPGPVKRQFVVQGTIVGASFILGDTASISLCRISATFPTPNESSVVDIALITVVAAGAPLAEVQVFKLLPVESSENGCQPGVRVACQAAKLVSNLDGVEAIKEKCGAMKELLVSQLEQLQHRADIAGAQKVTASSATTNEGPGKESTKVQASVGTFHFDTLQFHNFSTHVELLHGWQIELSCLGVKCADSFDSPKGQIHIVLWADSMLQRTPYADNIDADGIAFSVRASSLDLRIGNVLTEVLEHMYDMLALIVFRDEDPHVYIQNKKEFCTPHMRGTAVLDDCAVCLLDPLTEGNAPTAASVSCDHSMAAPTVPVCPLVVCAVGERALEVTLDRYRDKCMDITVELGDRLTGFLEGQTRRIELLPFREGGQVQVRVSISQPSLEDLETFPYSRLSIDVKMQHRAITAHVPTIMALWNQFNTARLPLCRLRNVGSRIHYSYRAERGRSLLPRSPTSAQHAATALHAFLASTSGRPPVPGEGGPYSTPLFPSDMCLRFNVADSELYYPWGDGTSALVHGFVPDLSLFLGNRDARLRLEFKGRLTLPTVRVSTVQTCNVRHPSRFPSSSPSSLATPATTGSAKPRCTCFDAAAFAVKLIYANDSRPPFNRGVADETLQLFITGCQGNRGEMHTPVFASMGTRDLAAWIAMILHGKGPPPPEPATQQCQQQPQQQPRRFVMLLQVAPIVLQLPSLELVVCFWDGFHFDLFPGGKRRVAIPHVSILHSRHFHRRALLLTPAILREMLAAKAAGAARPVSTASSHTKIGRGARSTSEKQDVQSFLSSDLATVHMLIDIPPSAHLHVRENNGNGSVYGNGSTDDSSDARRGDTEHASAGFVVEDVPQVMEDGSTSLSLQVTVAHVASRLTEDLFLVLMHTTTERMARFARLKAAIDACRAQLCSSFEQEKLRFGRPTVMPTWASELLPATGEKGEAAAPPVPLPQQQQQQQQPTASKRFQLHGFDFSFQWMSQWARDSMTLACMIREVVYQTGASSVSTAPTEQPSGFQLSVGSGTVVMRVGESTPHPSISSVTSRHSHHTQSRESAHHHSSDGHRRTHSRHDKSDAADRSLEFEILSRIAVRTVYAQVHRAAAVAPSAMQSAPGTATAATAAEHLASTFDASSPASEMAACRKLTEPAGNSNEPLVPHLCLEPLCFTVDPTCFIALCELPKRLKQAEEIHRQERRKVRLQPTHSTAATAAAAARPSTLHIAQPRASMSVVDALFASPDSVVGGVFASPTAGKRPGAGDAVATVARNNSGAKRNALVVERHLDVLFAVERSSDGEDRHRHGGDSLSDSATTHSGMFSPAPLSSASDSSFRFLTGEVNPGGARLALQIPELVVHFLESSSMPAPRAHHDQESVHTVSTWTQRSHASRGAAEGVVDSSSSASQGRGAPLRSPHDGTQGQSAFLASSRVSADLPRVDRLLVGLSGLALVVYTDAWSVAFDELLCLHLPAPASPAPYMQSHSRSARSTNFSRPVESRTARSHVSSDRSPSPAAMPLAGSAKPSTRGTGRLGEEPYREAVLIVQNAEMMIPSPRLCQGTESVRMVGRADGARRTGDRLSTQDDEELLRRSPASSSESVRLPSGGVHGSAGNPAFVQGSTKISRVDCQVSAVTVDMTPTVALSLATFFVERPAQTLFPCYCRNSSGDAARGNEDTKAPTGTRTGAGVGDGEDDEENEEQEDEHEPADVDASTGPTIVRVTDNAWELTGDMVLSRERCVLFFSSRDTNHVTVHLNGHTLSLDVLRSARTSKDGKHVEDPSTSKERPSENVVIIVEDGLTVTFTGGRVQLPLSQWSRAMLERVAAAGVDRALLPFMALGEGSYVQCDGVRLGFNESNSSRVGESLYVPAEERSSGSLTPSSPSSSRLMTSSTSTESSSSSSSSLECHSSLMMPNTAAPHARGVDGIEQQPTRPVTGAADSIVPRQGVTLQAVHTLPVQRMSQSLGDIADWDRVAADGLQDRQRDSKTPNSETSTEEESVGSEESTQASPVLAASFVLPRVSAQDYRALLQLASTPLLVPRHESDRDAFASPLWSRRRTVTAPLLTRTATPSPVYSFSSSSSPSSRGSASLVTMPSSTVQDRALAQSTGLGPSSAEPWTALRPPTLQPPLAVYDASQDTQKNTGPSEQETLGSGDNGTREEGRAAEPVTVVVAMERHVRLSVAQISVRLRRVGEPRLLVLESTLSAHLRFAGGIDALALEESRCRGKSAGPRSSTTAFAVRLLRSDYSLQRLALRTMLANSSSTTSNATILSPTSVEWCTDLGRHHAVALGPVVMDITRVDYAVLVGLVDDWVSLSSRLRHLTSSAAEQELLELIEHTLAWRAAAAPATVADLYEAENGADAAAAQPASQASAGAPSRLPSPPRHDVDGVVVAATAEDSQSTLAAYIPAIDVTLSDHRYPLLRAGTADVILRCEAHAVTATRSTSLQAHRLQMSVYGKGRWDAVMSPTVMLSITRTRSASRHSSNEHLAIACDGLQMQFSHLILAKLSYALDQLRTFLAPPALPSAAAESDTPAPAKAVLSPPPPTVTVHNSVEDEESTDESAEDEEESHRSASGTPSAQTGVRHWKSHIRPGRHVSVQSAASASSSDDTGTVDLEDAADTRACSPHRGGSSHSSVTAGAAQKRESLDGSVNVAMTADTAASAAAAAASSSTAHSRESATHRFVNTFNFTFFLLLGPESKGDMRGDWFCLAPSAAVDLLIPYKRAEDLFVYLYPNDCVCAATEAETPDTVDAAGDGERSDDGREDDGDSLAARRPASSAQKHRQSSSVSQQAPESPASQTSVWRRKPSNTGSSFSAFAGAGSDGESLPQCRFRLNAKGREMDRTQVRTRVSDLQYGKTSGVVMDGLLVVLSCVDHSSDADNGGARLRSAGGAPDITLVASQWVGSHVGRAAPPAQSTLRTGQSANAAAAPSSLPRTTPNSLFTAEEGLLMVYVHAKTTLRNECGLTLGVRQVLMNEDAVGQGQPSQPRRSGTDGATSSGVPSASPANDVIASSPHPYLALPSSCHCPLQGSCTDVVLRCCHGARVYEAELSIMTGESGSFLPLFPTGVCTSREEDTCGADAAAPLAPGEREADLWTADLADDDAVWTRVGDEPGTRAVMQDSRPLMVFVVFRYMPESLVTIITVYPRLCVVNHVGLPIKVAAWQTDPNAGPQTRSDEATLRPWLPPPIAGIRLGHGHRSESAASTTGASSASSGTVPAAPAVYLPSRSISREQMQFYSSLVPLAQHDDLHHRQALPVLQCTYDSGLALALSLTQAAGDTIHTEDICQVVVNLRDAVDHHPRLLPLRDSSGRTFYIQVSVLARTIILSVGVWVCNLTEYPLMLSDSIVTKRLCAGQSSTTGIIPSQGTPFVIGCKPADFTQAFFKVGMDASWSGSVPMEVGSSGVFESAQAELRVVRSCNYTIQLPNAQEGRPVVLLITPRWIILNHTTKRLQFCVNFPGLAKAKKRADKVLRERKHAALVALSAMSVIDDDNDNDAQAERTVADRGASPGRAHAADNVTVVGDDPDAPDGARGVDGGDAGAARQNAAVQAERRSCESELKAAQAAVIAAETTVSALASITAIYLNPGEYHVSCIGPIEGNRLALKESLAGSLPSIESFVDSREAGGNAHEGVRLAQARRDVAAFYESQQTAYMSIDEPGQATVNLWATPRVPGKQTAICYGAMVQAFRPRTLDPVALEALDPYDMDAVVTGRLVVSVQNSGDTLAVIVQGVHATKIMIQNRTRAATVMVRQSSSRRRNVVPAHQNRFFLWEDSRGSHTIRVHVLGYKGRWFDVDFTNGDCRVTRGSTPDAGVAPGTAASLPFFVRGYSNAEKTRVTLLVTEREVPDYAAVEGWHNSLTMSFALSYMKCWWLVELAQFGPGEVTREANRHGGHHAGARRSSRHAPGTSRASPPHGKVRRRQRVQSEQLEQLLQQGTSNPGVAKLFAIAMEGVEVRVTETDDSRNVFLAVHQLQLIDETQQKVFGYRARLLLPPPPAGGVNRGSSSSNNNNGGTAAAAASRDNSPLRSRRPSASLRTPRTTVGSPMQSRSVSWACTTTPARTPRLSTVARGSSFYTLAIEEEEEAQQQLHARGDESVGSDGSAADTPTSSPTTPAPPPTASALVSEAADRLLRTILPNGRRSDAAQALERPNDLALTYNMVKYLDGMSRVTELRGSLTAFVLVLSDRWLAMALQEVRRISTLRASIALARSRAAAAATVSVTAPVSAVVATARVPALLSDVPLTSPAEQQQQQPSLPAAPLSTRAVVVVPPMQGSVVKLRSTSALTFSRSTSGHASDLDADRDAAADGRSSGESAATSGLVVLPPTPVLPRAPSPEVEVFLRQSAFVVGVVNELRAQYQVAVAGTVVATARGSNSDGARGGLDGPYSVGSGAGGAGSVGQRQRRRLGVASSTVRRTRIGTAEETGAGSGAAAAGVSSAAAASMRGGPGAVGVESGGAGAGLPRARRSGADASGSNGFTPQPFIVIEHLHITRLSLYVTFLRHRPDPLRPLLGAYTLMLPTHLQQREFYLRPFQLKATVETVGSLKARLQRWCMQGLREQWAKVTKIGTMLDTLRFWRSTLPLRPPPVCMTLALLEQRRSAVLAKRGDSGGANERRARKRRKAKTRPSAHAGNDVPSVDRATGTTEHDALVVSFLSAESSSLSSSSSMAPSAQPSRSSSVAELTVNLNNA